MKIKSASWYISQISKYSKDIKIDSMGNVIARVGEKKTGGARVLLSAHMDEIGIIVTHIDDNVFCVLPPSAAFALPIAWAAG
jgi:putative aminopeptidase FrvX